MKKVLSILLSVAFLEAQALALSGGPVFTNGNQQSFIGTYAGVLLPDSSSLETSSGSSIGLFTLSQPDVGPAIGDFVAFVKGAAFIGIIDGIIDPEEGTLRGVLDASSTYQVTVLVPTTTVTNGVPVTTLTPQSFDVKASGEVQGVIVPSVAVVSPFGIAVGGLSNPARVTGTATLNTFFEINDDGTPKFNNTVAFELNGFKQSDAATGATTSFSNLSSLSTGG